MVIRVCVIRMEIACVLGGESREGRLAKEAKLTVVISSLENMMTARMIERISDKPSRD